MALNNPFPAYVPFMPPLDPFVMPPAAYDTLINAFGIRLTWQKSHLCPCIYGGQQTGSPDPACVTCSGYGYYWDAPSPIFNGLVSYMHLSPSPDEPGATMDEKFGLIQRSEPILTIPWNAGVGSGFYQDVLNDANILAELNIFALDNTPPAPPTIYQQASLNDVFVEVDAVDRCMASLQVSGIVTLPYQWNTNVALSGAVTTYNTATSSVVIVSGYTVSGATVLLPNTYPAGTNYTVEYYASRAWAAWRNAGSTPHDRPFAQTSQPKRFRLQQLDLWLRNSGKI